MSWEVADLAVAFVALIVSVLALALSVYFWRKQFRPIVTAAVRTHKAGGDGIAYDLVLLNSGSIPARNIRIKADESSLVSAFGADATPENKERWLACFTEESVIPILQNGDRMSCSFGTTKKADKGFWKHGAAITIGITYEGWFGRRFNKEPPQTIKIADSNSFTGYYWGER